MTKASYDPSFPWAFWLVILAIEVTTWGAGVFTGWLIWGR